MKSIDLNADLGESYGRFKVGADEALMPHLSSCNIACGFHGGDPDTILKTIRLAKANGVKIGAHPSYPDLSGFGRRVMQMDQKDLVASLAYQIAALKSLTEACGETLHHVKPHGALYNQMQISQSVREAVLEAVQLVVGKLLVYGPASKEVKQFFEKHEQPFWQEGFLDRRYHINGRLVARSAGSKAVLDTHEDAIAQGIQMVTEKRVQTIEGDWLPIEVKTICLHGDHPQSAQLAAEVTTTFKVHSIQVGYED